MGNFRKNLNIFIKKKVYKNIFFSNIIKCQLLKEPYTTNLMIATTL